MSTDDGCSFIRFCPHCVADYRGSLAMGGMTSPDIDDDDDVVMTPFTLQAERPFYENGNLKVNITWSNTWSEGKSKSRLTAVNLNKLRSVFGQV